MAADKHARLGPSNHRWPNCPGSVREESKHPNTAGDAAIDGTGSHILLEECLKNDLLATDYLGQVIGKGHHDKPEGWLVKPDRTHRVGQALAYIERRKEELSGLVHVTPESTSNPGEWFGRLDWWGTVDITIEAVSDGVLEIADYKDGRSYVSEKNNSQLISYAAGMLAPYLFVGQKEPTFPDFVHCKIKTVRMTIIQPKTGTPIRYQDMSAEELWSHAKRLAAAAALTDDPDAPLFDGDWCTWCRHGRSGNCAAKTKNALQGVSKMFENGTGDSLLEHLMTGKKSVADMSNDEISQIKDAFPAIHEMEKQVMAEMESRLDLGQQVPGYGFGTGKSSKVWVDDPETVAKKLKGMRFKKDDIYPSSLISVAQALKAEHLTDRQKKSIEKLYEVKPGKRTIVRSNQAEKSTAQDMFGLGTPADAPISFL